MTAFIIMTAVLVGFLLFFARWLPEQAAKDQINWNITFLVLLSVVVGMGLGGFPPFYEIQRFYVWDTLLPRISEVSESTEAAPKATRTGDMLSIDTPAPEGYILQVRYIDPVSGDPKFEMVKDVTYELPAGATGVQVRFVKGNLVTGWTKDLEPEPAVPPAPAPTI